jgi:hypothetical protein
LLKEEKMNPNPQFNNAIKNPGFPPVKGNLRNVFREGRLRGIEN